MKRMKPPTCDQMIVMLNKELEKRTAERDEFQERNQRQAAEIKRLRAALRTCAVAVSEFSWA